MEESNSLSIIIPTLNEARLLSKTLGQLRAYSTHEEIIVVDGGSSDATFDIARQYTPNVFASQRGRGIQQDVGARHASGKVLVFLHADTTLPQNYSTIIYRTLSDPNIVFGSFRLSIHPSTRVLELICFMANLRSRLFSLPYGDQALFVRSDAYFQAGGFRPWPIMEDVDLVHRLSRVGSFKLARASVITSARRWQHENPIYATIRNWALMLLFLKGVPPHVLYRHYRDTR